MKRLNLKSGDIFEVPIDGETKQYFQYLLDDSTCLGGNVIRAFEYEVGINEKVDLSEISEKKVKFHTHVILKGGVKLGIWEKIGNVPLENDLRLPSFRDTDDVTKPEVKKSYKWFVWNIGGEHKRVGELTEEYKKIDIGGVVHPLDVVKRLKTGSDGFRYPE